jgi:hypothetical protein
MSLTQRLASLTAELKSLKEVEIPAAVNAINNYTGLLSAANTSLANKRSTLASVTAKYNALPGDMKLVLNTLQSIDTNTVNGIHALINDNSIQFHDALNPDTVSTDGNVYVEL